MAELIFAVHDIKLNLTESKVPPTVHVKQYDQKARLIRCTLFEGRREYTIPNGASLICSGARPDGGLFCYRSAEGNMISQINNRVIITVSGFMTENAGRYPVDVVLADSQGSILRTFSFILHVEPCAVKNGKVLKRAQSSALTEISETILEVFITDDGYLAIRCNDGSFIPQGSVSDIVEIVRDGLVNASIDSDGKMEYATEPRYGLSFAMDGEGKIHVNYEEGS